MYENTNGYRSIPSIHSITSLLNRKHKHDVGKILFTPSYTVASNSTNIGKLQVLKKLTPEPEIKLRSLTFAPLQSKKRTIGNSENIVSSPLISDPGSKLSYSKIVQSKNLFISDRKQKYILICLCCKPEIFGILVPTP